MSEKIYKLTKSVISSLFEKSKIGIYVLGNYTNDYFKVGYVGRSDTDLRYRLLQHSKNNQYSYFYYIATNTIFEAFKLECREWHRFFNIKNSIHPDAPNNIPYICPYCNGAKEIHQGLKKRGA